MKKNKIKVLITFIVMLCLTGCTATTNINIDKNKITETTTLNNNSSAEYYKIKNWSGFPLPLYFDQSLKNPFDTKRSKEKGVSYYDVTFDNDNKTAVAVGKFTLDNHNRSSVIRGCFKYYNIVKNNNITTFSTSNGLICRYTNFKIVVTTPYTVVNNNATSVDANTNTYVWNVNNSNKNNVSVYLDIDFSKKFNEEEKAEESSNHQNNDEQEKTSNIVVVILIIIAGLIVALYYYLKYKKNKNSSI